MVRNQLSGFPSNGHNTRRRTITMKSRTPTSCRRRLRKSHCLHHRCYRRFIQSDWSNIHFDVLERAQKKLPFADTLQCRAVCNRWRSLTQTHISSSLYSPPPVAHLPPLIFRRDIPQFLDHPAMPPAKDFYPLSRKEKTLLDPSKSVCVGYSHDCFLFLHTRNKNRLCLFHPWSISRPTVCIPRILTPKGFFPILTLLADTPGTVDSPEKVVFWGDPILSNGNYGIAVLHQLYKRILFAKSGATQFTIDYHLDLELPQDTEWTDLICFRSFIYAVGVTKYKKFRMAAWDCSCAYDSPVKLFDFHPELSSTNEYSYFYLVESQGELLLVSIMRPDMRYIQELIEEENLGLRELFVSARSPETIRVYKMDFSQMKWVQMDSLGDHVLFIMRHQNHSISSHEFPQYKGNTVYFSHVMRIWGMERWCIGVFNMEDGSMHEIWDVENQ